MQEASDIGLGPPSTIRAILNQHIGADTTLEPRTNPVDVDRRVNRHGDGVDTVGLAGETLGDRKERGGGLATIDFQEVGVIENAADAAGRLAAGRAVDGDEGPQPGAQPVGEWSGDDQAGRIDVDRKLGRHGVWAGHDAQQEGDPAIDRDKGTEQRGGRLHTRHSFDRAYKRFVQPTLGGRVDLYVGIGTEIDEAVDGAGDRRLDRQYRHDKNDSGGDADDRYERAHGMNQEPPSVQKPEAPHEITRPSRSSMTRSAEAATVASWVTSTRVRPDAKVLPRNTSSTAAPVSQSRFPVGSSASTTAGLAIRARAMATRCSSPPDSSAGR